ncbi:hypothetical protein [Streptomyces sp. NPDC001380]|uniref:hypothetical protein n=1 Tax=Streptomyces sp. NPDC001380 TaxID=3364566 RepID=UPI0036BE97CA
MNRRTALTGGLAGLALAGSLLTTAAVPASAATGSASPAPAASAGAKAVKGDGARMLCARAHRIERRIDRALTRLQAGPGVRGSIARLQQRVDNAQAAGHTAVHDYLSHRLDHRKSMVGTLTQRRADLQKVEAWCRTRGDADGTS